MQKILSNGTISNTKKYELMGTKERVYYRVVVTKKKDQYPLLEVAGFTDEKIADNYIENCVRKSPEWNEDLLEVRKISYILPPWAEDDNTLNAKLRYLKNRD